MSDKDIEVVLKSKARMCVYATQLANHIAGDLTSAYWSIVEGAEPPGVFFAQAKDRIDKLQKMIARIEVRK